MWLARFAFDGSLRRNARRERRGDGCRNETIPPSEQASSRGLCMDGSWTHSAVKKQAKRPLRKVVSVAGLTPLPLREGSRAAHGSGFLQFLREVASCDRPKNSLRRRISSSRRPTKPQTCSMSPIGDRGPHRQDKCCCPFLIGTPVDGKLVGNTAKVSVALTLIRVWSSCAWSCRIVGVVHDDFSCTHRSPHCTSATPAAH